MPKKLSVTVVQYNAEEDFLEKGTLMGKRIDWSEWDHLLGTKIDYEIAKKIGCEAPTVAKRRFKLKIKPFNSTPPKINWKKYDHRLGSMPDRELAKKIKCSATSVSRRRRKLNITIYGAKVKFN